MATSWLLSHLKIALLVHVNLYVYKWHYLVLVLVFCFLVVFLRFVSPSFLVIIFHFALSLALEAHLDTGIPANSKSVSIDSAHLIQGLPMGRAWYTQEDSNFRGALPVPAHCFYLHAQSTSTYVLPYRYRCI